MSLVTVGTVAFDSIETPSGKAAQNFCVLYTTIAFRIKKLASENMVTYAFQDANRALENLQQETAGAREIMKFEKAQIIIARAGELLQHTIELTADGFLSRQLTLLATQQ